MGNTALRFYLLTGQRKFDLFEFTSSMDETEKKINDSMKLFDLDHINNISFFFKDVDLLRYVMWSLF